MMDIATAIAESRERVKAMDETDRRAGFATPHQCGRDEVLEIAAIALSGAANRLKAGDIETAVSCAADALVMLEGMDK